MMNAFNQLVRDWNAKSIKLNRAYNSTAKVTRWRKQRLLARTQFAFDEMVAELRQIALSSEQAWYNKEIGRML